MDPVSNRVCIILISLSVSDMLYLLVITVSSTFTVKTEERKTEAALIEAFRKKKGWKITQ